MAGDNEQVILAAAEEEKKISRSIMTWVNRWPNVPDGILRIKFEQFTTNAAGEPLTPGMMLSTVAAASITKRYIGGGHKGEYQFALVYRIKPRSSDGERLSADEALNDFGDWAAANPPDLGDGITTIKVEAVSRGSFMGSYDNGDESHQIPMRIAYEVL